MSRKKTQPYIAAGEYHLMLNFLWRVFYQMERGYRSHLARKSQDPYLIVHSTPHQYELGGLKFIGMWRTATLIGQRPKDFAAACDGWTAALRDNKYTVSGDVKKFERDMVLVKMFKP